jgi:segregation and condensation protein B
MTEPSTDVSTFSLDAALESILLAASVPVSVSQLAGILERESSEIEAGLKRIQTHFSEYHGIRLQWHANRVQLTTAPEYAGVIEKFLGLDTSSRLSRAALETLAIVAYKQPITRPGIDSIRGVSSDGVMKNLLSKGLIEETGRTEGPGRPILYSTTPDFLQHFGLSSLEELPPLDEENPQGNGNGNQLLKD